MIKKVEGIIVSTVDYKESSKIINIFTQNDGIIGVLARGSKSIKSKLAATTNVLCYGIFHLNYREYSLPYLMEVDIKDSFKEIRKDIIKTNYALFLLELASGVYRHGQNENIYTLMITGLSKINENYDANVVTSIIELKLLEYLGIKPVINQCVSCGNKNDIVTISSYKGGYLCKDCVGSEYIYHIKTMKLIRMFYYLDLSKVTKLDISPTIKKELNQFIDDYYERYSGLYLKSKTFLQEYSKL